MSMLSRSAESKSCRSEISREEMEQMDPRELRDRYTELAETLLSVRLGNGIAKAMKGYDEERGGNICIMMDTVRRALVFTYGTGAAVKGSSEQNVFYIYPVKELREYKEILLYLAETQRIVSMEQEISKMLTAAVLGAAQVFDDYEGLCVYGGYDYRQNDWPPVYDMDNWTDLTGRAPERSDCRQSYQAYVDEVLIPQIAEAFFVASALFDQREMQSSQMDAVLNCDEGTAEFRDGGGRIFLKHPVENLTECYARLKDLCREIEMNENDEIREWLERSRVLSNRWLLRKPDS